MKITVLYIFIGLFYSSTVFSSRGEVCGYPDENRHTIMNGKMSFGYSSYQDEKIKYKSGYRKNTRKYYNIIRTKAYRASKFTIRVASSYFRPRIAVFNSRKEKFIGRPSNNHRGPWNRETPRGRKVYVSQVTFQTRKNYPHEPVRIIITSTRKNNKDLRGAEVFIHAVQTNMKCIYSDKKVIKNRGFKPGYYYVCRNGRFPVTGTPGLFGTTSAPWCKDGSKPTKRWLSKRP